MTVVADRPWVRRTDHILEPDPARVVSALFLPGQETESGESRSTLVLRRVLELAPNETDAELAQLLGSFNHRHRDLPGTWDRHATMVAHRLEDAEDLSTSQRLLIGAYFTQEFSVESAALCNPSMVPHPDQFGVADGATRFVMTLRAVGEGHISSVEFRTGTIDASDELTFDAAPTAATRSHPVPTTFSRTSFRQQLVELVGDLTNVDFVLDELGESFTQGDLDGALADLHEQQLTRGRAERTRQALELIARCTYAREFAADSDLQERVLMPVAPSEVRGMEDLRMVRSPSGESGSTYVGTYTAYDGRDVTMQLLRTDDFRCFSVSRLSGPGARNKGMALFPRRIDGRHVALSRADRESNGISTSIDMQHWERRDRVQVPQEPWEIVQLGNCGSPIETEAGWLVLTHGVGPMREYSIGAILLDLDDPTVMLGRLSEPLLSPIESERSGYVPNVVYSCGAMLHGRTLVLPYGCSDSRTRVALVDLDALLDALGGPRPDYA